MKRMDVIKRPDGWAAMVNGRTVAGAGTKAEAVRAAARKARSERDPITLKIHTLDGKIQEERTYPRSADLKRRKG
jgi:hypothetical protein